MIRLITILMSSFRKPEKPLTWEQKKKIAAQINNYDLEIVNATIEMAFCETHSDMSRLSLKRSMAQHRRTALTIKLLSSCNCGIDHSEEIRSEEMLQKLFSDQLQKFLSKKFV